MSKVNKKTLFLLLLPLTMTACAPSIYVLDRPTILQEEASGNWVDYEKQLLSKSMEKGASFLPEGQRKEKRAYLFLEGSQKAEDK